MLDDKVEAVKQAMLDLVEEDYSIAFSLSVGIFVGLTESIIKKNDGDPGKEITIIDDTSGRRVTIHESVTLQ